MNKKTIHGHGKKQARVKVRRYFIWLAVVAVAVIIVIVGLYRHNQNSTPVNNVLSTVTKNIKATYSNLAVNTSAWPAQMGSQQSLHDTAYNFSVSSQSMPSIYVGMYDSPAPPKSGQTTAANPAAAHAIIADDMEQAGFKTDSLNNKLPFVLYGRGKQTCFEKEDSQQGILTFTCYSKDQIKQVSQAAQPFVSAYNQPNTSNPIGITGTIGPITIKSQNGAGVISSSEMAGYDIAEAVVTLKGSKKLVLFYNKDGGQWHYITQAGDEYGFSCKDYMANPDVRAAMHNQICLGNNGQVRLDTNSRALQ